MIYTCSFNLDKIEYPFKLEKLKKSAIYGEIVNKSLQLDDYIQFEGEIDSVSWQKQRLSCPINVLCKIFDEKDSLKNVYNDIRIGDSFILKGTLSKGRGVRNPGEFNFDKYLKSSGIHALFSSYDVNDLDLIRKESFNLRQYIFVVRRKIQEIINYYHDPFSSGLLTGLLLADRRGVDYEVKEKFINAGVIHVLAVSGLHVGYMVLICLFLFNRLNIKLRILFTIMSIICFLIITGGQPSVFRASIMAVLVLISVILNREYNGINSLFFAAFILLLLDPNELFKPGFQLSFSAVLSILLLYPIVEKMILNCGTRRNYAIKLLLFSGVSISAQIGTLPFTLYYFNKLSLISVLANLFVIPLIGIIVAIGLFTIFVSLFWNWLALIYASANNLFSSILLKVVNISGGIEFGFMDISQFSKIDGLIFYAGILFFLIFWNRITNLLPRLIFLILLLANILLYLTFDNTDYFSHKKLTIVAIDVGQGDSFLLKFPNGKTALIDAGDATPYFDNGKRTILPLLKRMNINSIDLMMISHLDGDHYHGAYSIIKESKIDVVYKPPFEEGSAKDSTFEAFLKTYRIPLKYYENKVIQIGNCRVYILTGGKMNNTDALSSNNKSGVLKVVYGNTSCLFVGDAETELEDLLIDIYGKFLDSDFLKVGHHGSKSSSSDQFLDIVSPEYALISAGAFNKFNHPSPVVLRRLYERNVKIFRTDVYGAQIIETDGHKFTRINWKND